MNSHEIVTQRLLLREIIDADIEHVYSGLRNNSIFYGAAGFNDISMQSKSAEIGLWLLPEYWGQGFMKEALSAICDYGLNNLKLERIEGFVETENINCKRAMSKIDFQFEKTLKDFAKSWIFLSRREDSVNNLLED